MARSDDFRRYLEQARESGEGSITFDGIGSVEARRLARLAAAKSGPTAPERSRPAAPIDQRDSSLPGEGADETGSPDWRAALRASGGEVTPKSPTRTTAPARVPSEGAAQTAPAPTKGTRTDIHHGAPPPSASAASSKVAALPPIGLTVNTTVSDMFDAPSAFASLDEVAAAVKNCTRCALHREARNAVPGEGSATAELVCVGEGPGASEDETGRPFFGAAGQLLTSILAAINLARENVYICNVVKHRPPGNRTPLPDEMTACQPYLVRQIELVKPRVILALGTTAAQTLLNSKLSLGKLRGAIHRYNSIPLVVTYHPAALLRNPAWKRPTWEDVQIVRRLLDSRTDG